MAEALQLPDHPDQTLAFKEAMRHLAGAVSVITVGDGESRTGFTATSVNSFSVEPPTLLVCVNLNASSWPLIMRTGGFTVNLLSQQDVAVADRFSGLGGVTGEGRYADAEWTSATGGYGLASALAVIDCELDEAIERYSHAILLGRVRSVTTRTEKTPLLYWHKTYRSLGLS